MIVKINKIFPLSINEIYVIRNALLEYYYAPFLHIHISVIVKLQFNLQLKITSERLL